MKKYEVYMKQIFTPAVELSRELSVGVMAETEEEAYALAGEYLVATTAEHIPTAYVADLSKRIIGVEVHDVFWSCEYFYDADDVLELYEDIDHNEDLYTLQHGHIEVIEEEDETAEQAA